MRSFSIIICCYNSSSRITQTLTYLAKLKYPKELCEIILVDNNSSDDTSEIAISCWEEQKAPFSLIVVKESNAGLAYARKAGVLASKHDYGIFCDDDNWLERNYLVKANEIFSQNENIGLIGGASSAITSIDLPPWFYKYAEMFAVGIQSLRSGDVTHRKYLWGAGLCFRAGLMRRLYRSVEPQVSGRKGALLLSGDDGEICAWTIFSGLRLYYDEDLKFYHYIEDNRLSNSYFKKFIFEQDRSLWYDYSKFLTVRYFLLPHEVSFKGYSLFFMRYTRDLLYFILKPNSFIRIFKIERIIKKLS